MRYFALDTETTGISTKFGHRIIEIGMMELTGRQMGETYQNYLQPDRDIDDGAMAVHGITPKFLEGKPRFAEIAEELLELLRGSTLIIHNARFDLGFLAYEFKLLYGDGFDFKSVYADCIDTLPLARKKYPGQRNSLDALCSRLGVDNSGRDLHGALLDAELLAGVYLKMTGGQNKLSLDKLQGDSKIKEKIKDLECVVAELSDDDIAGHLDYLGYMQSEFGKCLWAENNDEG